MSNPTEDKNNQAQNAPGKDHKKDPSQAEPNQKQDPQQKTEVLAKTDHKNS